MGLLDPIIEFKDKFCELILSDEKCVELIGDDKFRTVPAVGLKYKKVYPYAYVPQTVDDASTIVCYEAVVSGVNNDTTIDVELTVWVMCHASLIPTAEGCRHDVLANRIDDLINHSRDFGVGKVIPYYREPATYTVPNYDTICRKMQYAVKAFNYRYGAKD